MGGFHTEWEFADFAISPQNGVASERCSGFSEQSAQVPPLLPTRFYGAGNQDFEGRDNSAEIPSMPELVSAETAMPTAEPANWGPFGTQQETARFERVRGGP